MTTLSSSVLDWPSFPMLTFWCSVTYYTPSRQRRIACVEVDAIAADLAVEVAEKLVKADKRRRVAEVVGAWAVQK